MCSTQKCLYPIIEIQELVMQYVTNNKIILFQKNRCIYCILKKNWIFKSDFKNSMEFGTSIILWIYTDIYMYKGRRRIRNNFFLSFGLQNLVLVSKQNPRRLLLNMEKKRAKKERVSLVLLPLSVYNPWITSRCYD